MIPGILEDYDLPELTWAASAARGECAVTWVSPVDAKGDSVGVGIVTRSPDEAGADRDGRKADDVARCLVVGEDPDWSDVLDVP